MLVALALVAGEGPHASHAAARGTIVFASDRAKLDPGEVYSVSLGAPTRDLTRSLAPDYGLAVSPVGDQIAFWSDRRGLERVYLARGDGSRLRVVRGLGGPFTAQSSNGGGLTFSADGRALLASFTHPRRPSYLGAQTVIYRIDVQRATASPVHECDGAVAAAPSGRLVACARGHETTVFDTAGNERFRLAGSVPSWSSRDDLAVGSDAITTAQRVGTTRIVSGAGAPLGHVEGVLLAWSPDGHALALARGQDLYVADLVHPGAARRLAQTWSGGSVTFTPGGRYLSTEGDGGAPVLVPVDGGVPIAGLDAGTGAWSRDGRLAYVRLTFPLAPGATAPLLVTDTHGEHPQVVGRFPADEGPAQPTWLPDGRHVLVSTGSCGGKGLFTVSASGGPVHALNRDPRDDESPSWAPDGTRIAYSVESSGCNGHGEPIQIETVAADGSGATRVTSDDDAAQGSFDGHPSFSPDGSRIAYEHGTFDTETLQTIPASGGTPTTIAGGRDGAWSPDGGRIAFIDGHSLMQVPSGGGVPTRLAPDPAVGGCGYAGLAWSPDGGTLAVAGGRGIYLVTLGAHPRARLAITARCTGNPSFSPDGTEIAFDSIPLHALGEQTSIMAARIDGSDLRTLSSVPFRASIDPSWGP